MKKCPFCAEDIQDAAIVCKHCGRGLKKGKGAATRVCPFCNASISVAAQTCPSCGDDVSSDAPTVATLATQTVNPLVWLFVLVFAGVVFSFVYNMNAGTAPAATVSPTKEAPMSTERKLATIDCVCPASDNDVQVLRFRSLLQQLSTKYGETPERIGDMTAASRNALREKGVSESFANIMEGMNQVLDRPGANQEYGKDPYANFLTMYIVLRNSGKNHIDAIANLRGVLHETGLQ